MTIDALVNLPARTQTPDTFNANADALFPQLNTFAAQANALAVAMNLNSTNDTSASSVLIGTGAKSFTVSTGKSFQPGMYLVIANTAAPSTNSMYGQITSYNSGTGALGMNILSTLGSGTFAAWTISQASAGGTSTGSNSYTGAQNFARATVASSATTSDIWGAAGNQINWTGTALCTGFPAAPQAGAERTLIIASAGAAFTAGANMLIQGVASGVTVVLAANDEVDVEAVSTTQFKLNIVKYDGSSIQPLRNYFNGFAPSTAGASTTLTLGAGQCADKLNTTMLTMAAAINKTVSAWAVGSGNGGLDVGAIGNNLTYHAYAIRRPDTGVVDALVSLAPDVTATVTMTIATPAVITWANHGLQVGSQVVFTTTGALPTGITVGTTYYVISAGFGTGSFEISATQGGAAINTSGTQSGVHTATSVPTLPTNYTQYRYLCPFRTNGSGQWVGFVYDPSDDNFRLSASVLDINSTNPGTSAVTATLGSIPVGVNVFALMNIQAFDSASITVAHLSDLAVNDEAPSSSVAPLGQIQSVSATSGGSQQGALIRTNTAAQIRYRLSLSAAGTIVRIATLGWKFRMGSK